LIFGRGEDQDLALRQTSGLALKSHLEAHFASLSPDIINYCKSMILEAFNSSQKVIRETAGNAISLLIFRGGLNIWPDILEFLIDKLSDGNDIESAVKTLSFIVEDSGAMFSEPKYEDEMQRLLPALSHLLISKPAKSPVIRATAMHTINMLIITSSRVIYESTEEYLQVLVTETKDADSHVKMRAVQGLTNILDFRTEIIIKYCEPTFKVILE
jgi:hypothetical protein